MRKLPKKQGFAPDELVTDKLRAYGAAKSEIGFRLGTSRACAQTIGLRVRISRHDGVTVRCSVSNRPDQLNASCPFTPPSKTLSTSSAIAFDVSFFTIVLSGRGSKMKRVNAAAASPKSVRAFARVYAGCAMSQDWCRADLHLTSTGAANLDDYLDHYWEPRFTRKAEDLYAQAATWLASDISAPTNSTRAISFAHCARSRRACF